MKDRTRHGPTHLRAEFAHTSMNTRAIWMIGLGATAMLMASQGVAAGDPWRVIEQSELTQALANAPMLQTESLGEPARGINV